MLTNDLNVSVGRPYTASGVPDSPAVTGALKLENDVEFFLTEGGDYLAFD
jgi:hypothetical protein